MINTNKCAWDKVYTTANVEDCRISIGDVNIILHNIIKEEKDHYEIKMEVHGIENIQISYEKLTGLIVKGSKETLNGRRNVRNTFKINEDIYDLKQLSASIHKGILTICIGKKQEYKEKVLCTLKNEELIITLNNNISKIQQSDKEINLEVKQKDINKAINSIKKGGTNIECSASNRKYYW